ncbi:GNAT family N-acetyltransferase [Amycolatopsis sp. 195334CR]|uniref:GNAT family N-acetyltransferase n=1 Tax=Amycolatopsis sp. 195334CR TaxID=2814588 RepID=UPI001A906876|nr:GNAT family N-acetyltransferase [Amycolatopsis sp. 195334CR]MBN6034285.1 GNAT family N-acetyltransferase [Amycolatopsis sp. 195334CR]
MHTSFESFAEPAAAVFGADPVRHTGALTAVASARTRGQAEAMVTVHDGDRLHGALVADRGWPAMVSGLPADAAQLVADALAEAGAKLPGASATVPEVEAFSHAWSTNLGLTPEYGFRQRVYELGTLVDPEGVRGEFRLATAGDTDILLRWRAEFLAEAVTYVPPEQNPEQVLAAQVAAGNVFGLWCVDGEPVSMAFSRVPEADMTRIGFVYTPPDQRGHGYAAAVTAGVSRRAQESGIKHVTLFTDDANPVSNRIYQRLGYQYVDSYLEVKFTGEPLRH